MTKNSAITILTISFLLFIVIMTLSGCGVNHDDGTRILKNMGYENIEIKGYTLFGCSKDDSFRSKFVATKDGQQVRGVLCGGILKGITVRQY